MYPAWALPAAARNAVTSISRTRSPPRLSSASAAIAVRSVASNGTNGRTAVTRETSAACVRFQ
jgi:hypothetical protein